jgi:hypothetical protein
MSDTYFKFKSSLDGLTSSPEFIDQLSLEDKEASIRHLTDSFSKDVEDQAIVDNMRGLAESKNQLFKSTYGQYRSPLSADDFVNAGIEIPDLTKAANKDEALSMVSIFRETARTADFDYLNREDKRYQAVQAANQLERQIRGEDTGRTADLGYRAMQGFMSGLLRGVGADETADKLETSMFPENPRFEDPEVASQFANQLAQGSGDFLSSMTIFLGATALSGGNPAAGLTASLATNATRRYGDAYNEIFRDTGNEEMANEAGINAMPAAAVETIADKIVGGKFLGKATEDFSKAYKAATSVKDKASLISRAITDTSVRRAVVSSALAEGIGEASGEKVASLGMVAATGNIDYDATTKELWDSFLVGGILGGAVGGGGQAYSNFGDTNSVLRANQSTIKDLMGKGDFNGVVDLFNKELGNRQGKVQKPSMTPARKPATKPTTTAQQSPVVNQPNVKSPFTADAEKDGFYNSVFNTTEEANQWIEDNKENVEDPQIIKVDGEEKAVVNFRPKTEDFVKQQPAVEEEVQETPELNPEDEIEVVNQYGKTIKTTNKTIQDFNDIRMTLANLDEIQRIEEDSNSKSPATGELNTGSKRKISGILKTNSIIAARLDDKVPNRARYHAEVDAIQAPRFTDQVKNLIKRIVDANAITIAADTGLDIDTYYERLGKIQDITDESFEDKTKLGKDNIKGLASLTDGKETAVPLNDTFDKTGFFGLIEIAQTGDLSTFLHEFAHVIRMLGNFDLVLDPNELQALEDAAGVVNGQWSPDGKSDEILARQFEAWLRNPNKSFEKLSPYLIRAFDKIKTLMQQIYSSLKGSKLPHNMTKDGRAVPAVNPTLAKSFEKLFKIDPEFGQRFAPSLNQNTDPVITNSELELAESLGIAEVPVVTQQQNQPNIKSEDKLAQEDLPTTGSPANFVGYHGGGFSGDGNIKPSKEGSLGWGYYITPNESRAKGYAEEFGKGSSVSSFEVSLNNPIVINTETGQMVEAQLFEFFGMSPDKALEKADKITEEKGYVGSQFKSLGQKLGHDGIIQIRNGQISEAVAWNRNSIDFLGTSESKLQQSGNPKLSMSLQKGEASYLKEVFVNRENLEEFREVAPSVSLDGDLLTFDSSDAAAVDNFLSESNLLDNKDRGGEGTAKFSLRRFSQASKYFQDFDTKSQSKLRQSDQDAPQSRLSHSQSLSQDSEGKDSGQASEVTDDQLSKIKKFRRTLLGKIKKQLKVKPNKKSSIIRTQEDVSVANAIREISKFAKGLHASEPDSKLFYDIVNNFFKSRGFTKTDPANRKGFSYTENIDRLAGIHDRAAKAWWDAKVKWYQSRGLDLSKFNFFGDEVGGTYESAMKFINEKYDELMASRPASEADAQSEESVSAYGELVNEHQLDLSLMLASRLQAIQDGDEATAKEIDDQLGILPPVTAGVMDNLQNIQRDFLTRLASLDTDSILSQMNPIKAERMLHKLHVAMDGVLNDGGQWTNFDALLDEIAGEPMQEFLEKNPQAPEIFRDPEAGSYFNTGLGRAITKQAIKLSGLDTNLRRTSLVDAGIEFARALSQEMEGHDFAVAKLHTDNFDKFQSELKKKHFGKDSNIDDLHLMGLASKLIQTHSDLDEDGKNKEVVQNAKDLIKGFRSLANNDWSDATHGESMIEMMTQFLAEIGVTDLNEFEGLTQEKLVNHLQDNYPSHWGYMSELSDHFNQYVDKHKFVTQFFHNMPFRPVDYYLPTEPIPNNFNNTKGIEVDDIDGAAKDVEQAGIGGVQAFQNLPRSSQGGTSKQRTGLPESYHYNTNIEAVSRRKFKHMAMDIFTIHGRKLLKSRLNNKSLVDIVGKESRVKFLQNLYKGVVEREMREFGYISDFERIMKGVINRMPGPLLSGLHQFLSQPGSAYLHHIQRDPKNVKYYQAAHQLNMMLNSIRDTDPADLTPEQLRWQVIIDGQLAGRHPMGQEGFDGRRTVRTSMDTSRLEKMLNSHIFKELAAFDEKARKILFKPIMIGDMQPTRHIHIAELLKKAEESGQNISDISNVDPMRITDLMVSQVNAAVDENVNVSRSSRRGELYARPSSLMYMLTAFSGHRVNVGTGVSVRARNIKESKHNSKEAKESWNYIRSAIAQSLAFTVTKTMINGFIAAGIGKFVLSGLGQAIVGIDEEDEKEKDILEKEVSEFMQRNISGRAVLQSLIRDAAGNTLWMGAFGGLDNFLFDKIDPFWKSSFDEEKEIQVADLKEEIRQAKRSRNDALVDQLTQSLEALENQRYIPLAFQSFDSFNLGGAYQAASAPVQEFTREAIGAMVENKEFDWTEFVVAAKVAGYGQADISRLIRVIESSQNAIYEKRQREREKKEKENKGSVGNKYSAPVFEFK